jgi:hypothetical protein
MMIEAAALSARACGFEGFDGVPEDDAPVPEVERSITGLGYRFTCLCVQTRVQDCPSIAW